MYDQNITSELPYFENYNERIGTIKLRDFYKEKDDKKIVFDTRLDLVSKISCADPFQLFLLYMSLATRISNEKAVRTTSRNRYVALLDMGYLPVVMVPCVSGYHASISRAIVKLYPQKMRELKIPYIFEYTRNPEGKSVSSDFQDVWVNRLDIAKFMNCDPMQIKIGDFLRRIAK